MGAESKIEWTLPGALSFRLHVEAWDGLGPHYQRLATEADVRAAGYVPLARALAAETELAKIAQLAEATGKLVLLGPLQYQDGHHQELRNNAGYLLAAVATWRVAASGIADKDSNPASAPPSAEDGCRNDVAPVVENTGRLPDGGGSERVTHWTGEKELAEVRALLVSARAESRARQLDIATALGMVHEGDGFAPAPAAWYQLVDGAAAAIKERNEALEGASFATDESRCYLQLKNEACLSG